MCALPVNPPLPKAGQPCQHVRSSCQPAPPSHLPSGSVSGKPRPCLRIACLAVAVALSSPLPPRGWMAVALSSPLPPRGWMAIALSSPLPPRGWMAIALSTPLPPRGWMAVAFSSTPPRMDGMPDQQTECQTNQHDV
eukprot:363609-Chlamydomonas_euryale.AAC.21